MTAEDSTAVGMLFVGGFAIVAYFVFASPGIWLAILIWKRGIGGIVWPWLFALTLSLFVAPGPLFAHHMFVILPAPLSWAFTSYLGLPISAWHFFPAGTAFVVGLGAGLLRQRHLRERAEFRGANDAQSR